MATGESLHLAKKVFEEMPKHLHSNLYVLASLIDASMNSGDVTFAEVLFNRSPKKDIAMYGAMMKGKETSHRYSFHTVSLPGYIKNDQPNQAITLFHEIHNPNDIILNLFFNACAQLGTEKSLHLARKIFEEMPKHGYSNLYVLTSMLDASMKCGDVAYAESVFKRSTSKGLPMYGAMMKGKETSHRHSFHVISLSGYIKNHQPNQAISLFHEIQNPDETILSLLFNACAHVGTEHSLHLAKKVFEEIPKHLYSSLYVLTSLIDASMKCGDVTYAEALFNKSPKKDITIYGAMMQGNNGNLLFVCAVFLSRFYKEPSGRKSD